MHWTPRREAFRSYIARRADVTPVCWHPASVFDPMSARIAADLGYEMGMFAGSVAALTVLGAPDLITLTASEFAQQALRINRASDLPLLVDADHGYGNALNVRRTVCDLETAGVAGLTIEDTDLPTPYGHAAPRLISREEGLGKIRAALDARSDPALVIAARTSAMAITGQDDAVERIAAYVAAGADAVFLTGVRTAEQLAAVRDAVAVPIFLGGAGKAVADNQLLADHGVRISLLGHQPIAAAVQAVQQTMAALRAGTPPNQLAGIADASLMQRVTRGDDHQAWQQDFLGLEK